MHVPLVAYWPAGIPAGKVSHDLVDSTDFLPTLCDAAGATIPAELKIDGRSFYPQLRGQKGNPRQWIYSWYAPNQGVINAPREFAATQRYKLYRSREFYDYAADPREKTPLDVQSLTPEAAAVRKRLEGVLVQFKDALPEKFPKPMAPEKK
jgi:arylsulfatase A